MLSKRANDILFIGIIVLVLVFIIIGRVMTLSTMDNRIEDIEQENEQLQAEISGNINLVEEYRDENIPTASYLSRYIPSHYSRNTLMYFIYAQLELEGVRYESGRDLLVDIHENVTYPTETRFSELSNEFYTNRIEIRFNTNDLDEIDALVTQMYSADQVFLVQNVRYEVSETENVSTRVVMNFVTFYNIEPETEE